LEIPTLDLGEFGAQIDAALQDSEPEAPDAPEPQDADPPADDSPGENDASGEPDPPAAGAGDDFEARFRERFERDYAERSKQDIARLRSGLDRRISTQKVEIEDLREEIDIAEVGFDRALAALAEYDPQAAEQLRGLRDGVKGRSADQRKIRRYEQAQRAEQRRSYYAKVYGGAIDPEDPELLDAFERGDERLERALLGERAGRLGLVLDRAQGRYVRPAQAAPAAEREPKAPARDDQGRFVGKAAEPDPVAAKVAATREREQQRGRQILSSGQPAAAKPERNLDKAAQNFQQRLKAMGLG